MGRYSTGAITTIEVCRIELKFLLKQGLIKKNCKINASLSWNNESNISIYSSYTEQEKYIRLKYTLTETSTGNKFEYDYNIELIEKPSNLGKGKVLYFVCPETNNNCRILYRCYGYHKWKSRKAYKNRIYYESQTCSKYDYFNKRYWQLDKQIKKLKTQRKSYLYKDLVTKKYIRLQRLKGLQKKYDYLRITVGMPKSIRKHIGLFN